MHVGTFGTNPASRPAQRGQDGGATPAGGSTDTGRRSALSSRLTRRVLVAAGGVLVGNTLGAACAHRVQKINPVPTNPSRTTSAMLGVGAYFPHGTVQERAALFTQALEQTFYPQNKGIVFLRLSRLCGQSGAGRLQR